MVFYGPKPNRTFCWNMMRARLAACSCTTIVRALASSRPRILPAQKFDSFCPLVHVGAGQVIRLHSAKAYDTSGKSKRKDDAAWKESLTEAEFYVLREKGTEPPGSGPLNKFYPKVSQVSSRRIVGSRALHFLNAALRAIPVQHC